MRRQIEGAAGAAAPQRRAAGQAAQAEVLPASGVGAERGALLPEVRGPPYEVGGDQRGAVLRLELPRLDSTAPTRVTSRIRKHRQLRPIRGCAHSRKGPTCAKSRQF